MAKARRWVLPALLSGSFARGLAVLTSASVLQNLIVFAAAPVLARLFTPEAFGVAGLIQALGALPVLIATGQYYLALGITRHRTEAANVAALSLLLCPLLALALLPPVLLLQADPGWLPESMRPAAAYLWTIPGFMVASGVLFVTRLWEIRHANYRSMVASRLIESGGMAVSQIGFGLLALGPLGLIVGRWLGAAAAALHGLRLLYRQIGRAGLRRIRLRRLSALARRHWRFPVYQLPANMLNELAQQLTPILLAVLYTIESVGFYWFATRLLERPAIVLGENVGRVFYQHAADRRQAGERVSGLYWKTTALLAIAGLVPFGLVIAFGPELFAFVFGAEWEMAGHYARWIALANFVMLIAFPARGATALFGLQGQFLAVEAVRATTSALALVAVALADGDELLAIAASAAVQSLIMLGFITFVAIRLRQLDRASSAASGGPRSS